MANPLGRISGQLLKDNLTLDGRDWLAFDTDLLYLNTNGRRIGVNTDVPTKQLEITGTTTTTNLIVDRLLDTIKLGTQVRISGSTLTSLTENLNLTASNYVFGDNIRTSKLDFNNNVISSLATDTKIEIRPDQTGIDPLLFGSADIYSNLNVTGNLYTPYNITLDGNINFGSDNNDTIKFNADINSNIIPNVDAPSISYPPAVTATWLPVRFKYDVTGYTNLFLFWYVANTPWNLWVDANVHVGNHVYATRNGVRKYYGTVTAKPVIAGISAGDQITFTVSNPENHPAYFDYPDPIYATTFEISAVPDGVRGFSLGSNFNIGGKRWEGIYTELINGEQASANSIAGGGVNLALRPGKSWYVATNGLDTNVGDHQSGPFATIKHALDAASAGDTVHIYPGTYTEIFPLTVKVGVAVKGTGIRSVTVQPTALTQTNNAFLLNGETTVSDLTVKDFYAPGCAFSFAPGFTVSTRSPYVQNITVLTKGSVTSLGDPRGFDEGDAGGGAYVDGSLATSSSKEASMLFHSVTFITPGVDAITMTNGVRVEWLNSFTYFANRGLYAINGTLGLASLGVRFGAEIRSIGSANIYGNYGAEANGASTLMYLIQHNFAYIGAGKDSTNDPSLNIADNETVEIAAGKIYYQSLDNRGNFRVGDAFGVSFDTGRVTINGVSVSAGGVTSINFLNGTDETVIDARQISTGNVKFSDNLLTTLSGALNLDSGTNEINLNANTDITDSLDVTGNLNVDGTLTIGNAYIDVVRFTAPVEFNLRPKTDDDYTLGGPTNKRWDKVYLDTSYIGSYKLENATISTLPTDADIELRANSVGKIYIPTNNVEIDNDLTVHGTTNFGDNVATLAATITGTIDHTGLLDRTGDTTQTGTYNQDGYLDVSSDVQIANVTFIDNTISTVTLDSNLELGAASTGKLIIPSADVQIDNNLFVTGDVHADSVITNTDITTDVYNNGNIEISLDLITTTLTDSDLEFRAAGTGKVYASQDSVKFDQDLTVDGITALRTTNITGDITQYGDYFQTGNTLQTGNRSISSELLVHSNAYFDSMSFVANTITTTDTDTDLRLKAVGSGIIDINDNATFSQNLRVNSTTYTNGITNSDTITSDTFRDGDIEISTNNIKTTVGSNNLRLLAAGSGIISVPNDAVEFNNNLTVNGTTSLKNTVIGTGVASLTAGLWRSKYNGYFGGFSLGKSDADTQWFASETPTETIAVANFDIIVSLISVSAQWLGYFRAPQTANYTFDSSQTDDELYFWIGAKALSGYTSANADVYTHAIYAEPTTVSNPIPLVAGQYYPIRMQWGNESGGGGTVFKWSCDAPTSPSTDFTGLLFYRADTGFADNTLTLTGNYLQTGDTVQTGNRSISLTLDVDSNAYFDSMSFVNNVITTTDTDTDLSLKAAGTGLVVFDENTTFSQGLTVATLVEHGITNSGITTAGTLFDNDIQITSNIITTTVGNNNLRLLAAGTGIISVPNDAVQFDNNLTVNTNTSLKNVNIGGTAPITTVSSMNYNANGTSAYFFRVYGPLHPSEGYERIQPGWTCVQIPGAVVVSNVPDPGDNNESCVITITGGTFVLNTFYSFTGYASNNITLTGNYLQTGNTLQTGNRSISAQLLVRSNAYFDSMSFVTNTITTTDTNTDLSLKAAGSGLVVFDENTTFSQRLTASTLVTNGLTNSGTITSDIFTDGDIEINDNYITTTVGSNDLRLVPNGSGKVSMPLDPVAITQALTVQDASILKNTTINGDIVHTGNTTQTGNVIQTGDLDLSNTLTVTGTDAFFTDVRIINNRIATSTGNNNLELRADGTAIIKIADSATFGQTLTVNGITTTSAISAVTGTITSDIFTDSDIEINDNYITTTVGNNNLILLGNTTGGPKLEKIKFNSNVISTETTNEGITLTVPSGSVTISAATALKVPVGTTVNRPILTQGEFRFNSTDNLFRGYSTATVSFAGVYSADRRTSVLAHPTNNTLLFTTNTLNNMTVSSTGLTVNSLTVDNNLTFVSNIISTAVTNNSLYLTPNGTGKVVMDDVALRNDEIINSANAALVIQNAGNGYVKFSGTGGLALPAGPTVVDTSGVELGDLRYNTDLSIPEIFNGVDYVGFVSENAALLNAAEVQEITNLWALVIG